MNRLDFDWRRGSASLLALVLASSCAMAQNTPDPAVEADLAAVGSYATRPSPTFVPGDHTSYLSAASRSTLEGEAFLRQAGGGLVTCAGESVEVFPATPYFKETLLRPRFVRGAVRASLSSEAGALVFEGTCDSSGQFAIDDLPSGNWIVVSQVIWHAFDNVHGGPVCATVSIPAPRKVTLSKVNCAEQ